MVSENGRTAWDWEAGLMPDWQSQGQTLAAMLFMRCGWRVGIGDCQSSAWVSENGWTACDWEAELKLDWQSQGQTLAAMLFGEEPKIPVELVADLQGLLEIVKIYLDHSACRNFTTNSSI